MLDRLKAHAAASGTTVSRLIEEAVKVMLNRPPEPPASGTFELLTYGSGGRFSKYNLDKASELIAAEDRERYGEDE